MTTQPKQNLCDKCAHAHYTGETLRFMGKQINRRICTAKKINGQPQSITVAAYSECREFSAAGNVKQGEAV